MAKFAFDMFDDDHSGSIDKAEVRKLYKMCMGKKKNYKEKADDLLRKMDSDGDGTISWNEFNKFRKKLGSLMKPAFELRGQMRKNIIGPAYWDRMNSLRQKYAKGRDIIELQHTLITGEKKLDRKALKQKATKSTTGSVARSAR